MKKKTTSEIRESVRKELTKAFEHKYEMNIKSLERFKELYHNQCNRTNELSIELNNIKIENDELKEKVHQYEDWIERLQSFMDIKDDKERKIAFDSYIKERQTSAELSDLMGVYSGIMSRVFDCCF